MAARIAGVAFDGVDNAVFDFFYDTDMVGNAVLTAFVGVVPVEEDDIAWVRGVGVVLPLVAILEPFLTNIADCKAGDHTVFEVATFVGAPAHKDGAPIYSLIEAVPSPVGFTAYITNLGQGYATRSP